MNEKIIIGYSFGHDKKRGIILQETGKLPLFHDREDEKGPFYGVSYNTGKYIWYSRKQMEEIFENNKR